MALDLAKQVLIQITRKASKKIRYQKIVFFNQNHPNSQKMKTKFKVVQTKCFFRIQIKKYSHFQRVTTKQE